MKSFIYTLLLVFATIIVVGLGSVLLVLWAYGAGQVMLRILPSMSFNSFEATLLNLVGVLIVGMMVLRIVSSATSNSLTPKPKPISKEDKKSDESKDDSEDVVKGELSSIPRWRQPLKNVDFSKVKPNDPCPCGSGRKYKSCHGYKQTDGK